MVILVTALWNEGMQETSLCLESAIVAQILGGMESVFWIPFGIEAMQRNDNLPKFLSKASWLLCWAGKYPHW